MGQGGVVAEARRQNPSIDPGRVLQEHLSRGVTGCLSLRTRKEVERRVYLMQGEILAAHGPDDPRAVLRRLVNNGAITESQSDKLLRRVTAGEGLDELLFGQIPDELLLDVLAMRFRQNLLEFLMADGEPAFEAMDAVFVDNIQVGHDTRALVEQLLGRAERIRPLRSRTPGARVLPGPGGPSTMDQARLLDQVGSGLLLSELIEHSPLEEGETLDLVASMIGGGGLRLDGLYPASEDEPTELGADSLLPVDEDALDSVPPADLEPLELSTVHQLDAATLEVSAELTELEDLAPEALAELPAEAPTDPPHGDEDLELEYDDATQSELDVAPTQHERAEQAAQETERLEGEALLRAELEAELAGDAGGGGGGGEQVVRPPGFDFDLPDSDELAMFEDQDFYRGRGEGGYSTERHNLDRVELVRAPEEDADLHEEGPIAVEDDSVLSPEERRRARTTNFSAPRMDEDEAQVKADLVNVALHELAEAYVEGNGPGSGKVFVQLLLEGAPAQFKPLLQGLEPDAEGRIPVAPLVRNLMARPEAERRQLFQRAASDLFERALTLAYDDLDEELADKVAEHVLEIERRLEKMA